MSRTGRAVLEGAVAVVAALMVAALLISLAGFWRQHVPPWQLCILAAAATGVAWAGWRRPGRLALTLLLLLAVPAGLALARRALARPGTDGEPGWAGLLLDRLGVFLLRLHVFLRRAWEGQFETLHPSLAWFFLGLAAVAAAVFLLREALGRGDAFWPLAAGAGLFAFQWVLFWDEAQDYLILYLALGLLLWALGRTLRRTLDWKAEGRAASRPPDWAAAALAVLVAAGAAGALGVRGEATDPSGPGDRLRALFPALQRLRGDGYGGGGAVRFSLRLVGWGGSTEELGGAAVPDPSLAFRVTLDRPLLAPLYLRGSVHTTYTGRGWLPPGTGDRVRRGAAPLPAHYAEGVPLDTVRLTVDPVTVRTDTLFHLLEPVRVEGVTAYRADRDQNLLAAGGRNPGQPYTVESRVARISADQVRSLARVPDPSDPDLAPYLQLPWGSRELQWVAALAQRVVTEEGAAGPYEQAEAIERYLRRRYRYTLDAPAPPRGRDFVAYFLFQSRQGYCTAFSTAMAVVLRTLGLPTRWVQGFVVLPTGTNRAGVPQSQAHAWVEVYFPGYGWVPFDPTPRPDVPLPERMAAAGGAGPAAVQPAPPETPPPAPAGEDPRPAAAPPGTPPDADAPRSGRPAFLAAAAAVLALAGGAGAALALARGLGRRRAPAAVRVQQQYLEAAALLRRFGLRPLAAQTPREYAAAVARAWPEMAGAVGHLAAAYERARYGPPPPASGAAALQAERARGDAALAEVRRALRRRFGPVCYALACLLPFPLRACAAGLPGRLRQPFAGRKGLSGSGPQGLSGSG